MIPRIGSRGMSFKACGQYMLHDKKADTKERVVWTYTHNLPTDNPELAMKIMAYTAINRNKLKQEAGVPLTGRKGVNKPVYTFSLGWSPDQKPDANHMRDKAIDALSLLGLKDHEAVFVAHNDTAHPHVHCVVNLVNPGNGKTLRPQNDRLKLSTWAEAYEKQTGKVYCEQRVINNEERRQGKKVKHRSDKVEKAATIQNLYNQAEDARAFQKALEDNGYTLGLGDRRGFVLVDQDGKISSLSRQLKGQRAKDIRERLADLSGLPHAQTLADERQYFLRDQYETERQKKIVDSAIEAEEKRKTQTQKDTSQRKSDQTKAGQTQKRADKSFAGEVDQVRLKEEAAHRQTLKKEQKLRAFYKRERVQKRLKDLQDQLKTARTPAKLTTLQKRLDELTQNLASIDQRMREQNINPIDPAKRDFLGDEKLSKDRPDHELDAKHEPKKLEEQPESEEAFKARMKQQLENKRDQSKNKPRGPDL